MPESAREFRARKLIPYATDGRMWYDAEDADSLMEAYASSRVAALEIERDRLRMKLVKASDLLSDWSDTFNWKAWRTDTKHVSEERVDRLVKITSGREWDDDYDGYHPVKSEYLVETAEVRKSVAEAIAILDQAGDNREAALARLREVKG